MKIKRETIYAGKTKIISLRAATRIKGVKGEKRSPKINPTPEAVAKNNLRYAIKDLTAKLNHNFAGGDYHLTLTYRDEPDQAEAKRRLNNFLRNVRNACAKKETTFRRVAVTEYENKRIHHHIVCTGIDAGILHRYWPHGWINIKHLDDSGNYARLAEYLVKETEKTFRKEGGVFKRRYSASRNIVTPEARIEEVSERVLERDIEPTKGYYIDQDSVKRYDHAVLGVECVEYIEIQLSDHKSRKRGRKGKLKDAFDILWPRQLELEVGGIDDER